MNQYIKFIVRVLLTCFYCLLGVIIQVVCGLQHYVWGWLVGHFYNGALLHYLALHGQAIIIGDPYKAVRSDRGGVLCLLDLSRIRFEDSHVEAIICL